MILSPEIHLVSNALMDTGTYYEALWMERVIPGVRGLLALRCIQVLITSEPGLCNSNRPPQTLLLSPYPAHVVFTLLYLVHLCQNFYFLFLFCVMEPCLSLFLDNIHNPAAPTAVCWTSAHEFLSVHE